MTLEDIDRTIYELLRLKIVAAGYLPDITTFATPQEYRDAIEALAATLKYKQPVMLLGIGAENSRDDKRPNRIVIDRKSIIQGNVGSFGVTDFEMNDDGQTFSKNQRDATAYTIQYNIRCISNSAHYDRILNDIVLQTFSKVSYKSIIDGDAFGTETVLINQIDSRDVSSTDLLENLYTYQVEDVYIVDATTLNDSVKPISKVDISVEPTLDIESNAMIDTDPELEVEP